MTWALLTEIEMLQLARLLEDGHISPEHAADFIYRNIKRRHDDA